MGDTCLWCRAGDERLATLQTFATPNPAGYGGKQIFSSGTDQFYTAVQGVVTACVARATSYDRTKAKAPLPGLAALFLPLVVIDGPLFEGTYDPVEKAFQVTPTDQVRLHWRGSPSWPLHATLDIVRVEALAGFVEQRKQEVHAILDVLQDCVANLRQCLEARDLSKLEIAPGSRGISGGPALLADIGTWISKHKKET